VITFAAHGFVPEAGGGAMHVPEDE
jgi:hypothetical protein